VKILVTGGAGYIGSVCIEDLLNRGHNVTVFDNLTEGHRNAVDRRAKFVQGDLADKPALSDLMSTERPEAVMHFAANALVGESMQNPYKYFHNNVSCGLNQIAEISHRILVSSHIKIRLKSLSEEMQNACLSFVYTSWMSVPKFTCKYKYMELTDPVFLV
jgi:UDP-glucose 4-epimerase